MKQILKKNYKFLLFSIFLIILITINFPYYIDAPGGISDVSKKIDMEGYESKGSFNLAYVREYRATIPTLLISLFNKDWDVYKEKDIIMDNETYETYSIRDKILIREAVSNAIYVAYTKANKEIKIISNELYVAYIDEQAHTDLQIGDVITHLNGTPVFNRKEAIKIIESINVGDKLDIKVINKDKEYNRYSYIIDEDGNKKIGILLSSVSKYDTKPNVDVKIDKNESGSSGGLIMTLAIYNSLVPEDITHGKTIVGTGTIDLDGNVGTIGGVEYKLKSANKNKADLFIVPNGENYDEAMKLKKEKNYDIEIVGVSTFDEVLEYLKNL